MKRLIAIVSLTALAWPAFADRHVMPRNASFEEECGSCHLAFPPRMLDANSWRTMMNGLPKHFGTDASLDDTRRLAIASFLVAHAGGHKIGVTADAGGRPLLRITETSRFTRKHREVSDATWKSASVKSPANCGACHPRAAAGDFEEHGLRIPK